MTVARACPDAVRLADGRVLIAEGAGQDTPGTTSAEIYNPATGKFSPTGTMTTQRSGDTATLLENGKVLFAGGDVGGSVATAELYDPATGKFSLTGNMVAMRQFACATLLSDGRVLIAGGSSPLIPALSSAELYWP
jgi:hypothetical protein